MFLIPTAFAHKRKATQERTAIIENTYQSYFRVKFEEAGRVGSYNYTDLFTRTVELKMYNGEAEIYVGYIQSFIDVPEEEVDLSGYTQMSISEAREAQDEASILIEGTVAATTYAFGMVPNGVYVVDGESSIYVYGGDIAALTEKTQSTISEAIKQKKT